LTHYTTLAGLQGIIDSGYLRASNVSFLNDRRELTHGLDASIEAVKRLSKEADYAKWKDVLDKAVVDMRSGKIPNTYALCFCANRDKLSQWRGYGDGEQAVAVIFDRSKLDKCLADNKAVLASVIYGRFSTVSKMREELRREIDLIGSLDATLGKLGPKARTREARSIISKLLPRFKHIGFIEESEWRFIVQQDGLDKLLCFRTRGNVLVPYINLGAGAPEKLPIETVVVGPGADQELTQKSIEFSSLTASMMTLTLNFPTYPSAHRRCCC
jgi:hypothetical protein